MAFQKPYKFKENRTLKLSQDRDIESSQNIIRKIEGQNEDGRLIAEEIIKGEKDIFSEQGQ